MRRFAILAAPLAASVAAVAMQLPTTMASATSSDCDAQGICGGQMTAQRVKLELSTSVKAVNVTVGTKVQGRTTSYSPRGDWEFPNDIRTGDFRIVWAPHGQASDLCLTAPWAYNSRPLLKTCVYRPDSSIPPNQSWDSRIVVDGFHSMLRNHLRGYVLAVIGDYNGAPVKMRPRGTGTPAYKSWMPKGSGPQ